MITKTNISKNRNKLFIVSIPIFFISILIVLFGNDILVGLGDNLITEHPLEKADAIVVLAGSIPDRILEAVDLFNSSYAPFIILTKEQKPDGYDKLVESGIDMPEGDDLNRMIAIELGVPATSIIVIDKRANSTHSEMQVLTDFLGRKNFKFVLVVTSKSHTTRATKLFSLVNNGGKIKVITRPFKYDTFHPTKFREDLGGGTPNRDHRLLFLGYPFPPCPVTACFPAHGTSRIPRRV